MKRIGLLLCIVIAAALCATGQTLIDFSDMPSVNVPVPVPDDYPAGSYLNWDNFYYVSPLLWSGAGPGFTTGPEIRLAFVGGPMCSTGGMCSASIKVPVTPNSTASFQPLSITLSSGWVANNVVVVAYDHSKFLGSVVWNLTTTAQSFDFPTYWTTVTQLRFFPSPAQGQQGSTVIYTLSLNIEP